MNMRRLTFWAMVGILANVIVISARSQDLELGVTAAKTYTAPSDVTALAVSFGGRIAAGMKSGQLALWQQDSDKPVIIKAHEKQINAVQFSPDASLIATVSDDGKVSLWKAGTLERVDHFMQDKLPKALVVGFSPDGQSLAVGYDKGSARVWGIDSPDPARVFEHHKGAILAVSFKPRDSNTLMIIGDDKKMSGWNLSTGEQTGGDVELVTDAEKKGAGTSPKFFKAAVSADGNRFAIPVNRMYIMGAYAGSVDRNYVKLVRPTGEQKTIDANSLLVGSNSKPAIALSGDGRLLAVTGQSDATSNQMSIMDLVRGAQIGSFTVPSKIRYFAFGPGSTGYRVTVAAGSEVKAFPIDFTNSGEPTETLAVADLQSDPPDPGITAANAIRAEISRKNQYILLSPPNVKEMIDAIAMKQLHMSDPKSQIQTGKILLAKKNVYGSVKKTGSQYTVAMTLQDKETSKIEWTEEKTCSTASVDLLIGLAQEMTRTMLLKAQKTDESYLPPTPSFRKEGEQENPLLRLSCSFAYSNEVGEQENSLVGLSRLFACSNEEGEQEPRLVKFSCSSPCSKGDSEPKRAGGSLSEAYHVSI